MLGTLFTVAKVAFATVFKDSKEQFISPKIFDVIGSNLTNHARYGKIKQKQRKLSESERKVHEITTCIAQLILSISSLIKLIRAFIPNKIWKSPE